MLDNHPSPSGTDLAGFEYEGLALDIGWLGALAWVKFKKVFDHPDHGEIGGWNSAVYSDRVDAPWRDRVNRHGEVARYWPFALEARGSALWIVYGRRIPRWQPMAWVEDPLVCVNPGDPTLLLGCSMIAGLPLALPTTWFALRRGRPLNP